MCIRSMRLSGKGGERVPRCRCVSGLQPGGDADQFRGGLLRFPCDRTQSRGQRLPDRLALSPAASVSCRANAWCRPYVQAAGQAVPVPLSRFHAGERAVSGHPDQGVTSRTISIAVTRASLPVGLSLRISGIIAASWASRLAGAGWVLRNWGGLSRPVSPSSATV